MIELLIVLVILGILLVAGVPSYQDSVTKGRRADAKAALMELAARQERFYAQNVRYTTEISAASGLNFGSTSSTEGYYSLTSAACGGGSINTCFVLTATPIGAQADDADCTTLTLDNAGAQGATGAKASQCW